MYSLREDFLFIKCSNRKENLEIFSRIKKFKEDSHFKINHGYGWDIIYFATNDIISISESNKKCNQDALVLGHIYNKKKLESEVLRNSFKNLSLSYLMILLYQKYGAEFIKRVDGDFIIILYDKNYEKLYLYRDRLGLYDCVYTLVGGKVLISTRPSLLFATGLLTPRVNEEILPEYFAYRYVSGRNSLFKGIYHVPPSHYCVIGENSSTFERRYWNIHFREEQYKSNYEILKRIETTLKNVIRKQTTGPVANMLSGGVDSSYIQALTNNIFDEPIRSFSYGFIESKYDETEYAESAARFLKADHKTFILTPEEYCNTLPLAILANEYPIHLEQSVSNFWLFKKIPSDIKFLLCGYGADLNFGESLRKFRLAERLNHFFGPKFAKFFRCMSMIPNKTVRYYSNLIPMIMLKINDLTTLTNILEQIDPPVNLYHISKIFPNMKIKSIFEWRIAVLKSNHTIRNIFDEVFLLSIVSLTAAVSIWRRLAGTQGKILKFPFVDIEMLSFAASIPIQRKLPWCGLKEKPLLKKAACKYIPRAIVYRRKKTGLIHAERWFSKEKLFGKYIKEIYDYDYFNKYLILQLSGGLSKYDSLLAWNLLNFDIWYKIFFEGRKYW